MDETTRQFHRFHIDTYFDSLSETIELRKTTREKVEYLNLQICFEEQRLNRYYNELQPQLYTDHRLMVDEVKTLIHKLILLKNTYITDIENEGLKTFEWLIDTDKIEVLYNKLINNFIDKGTSLEVFRKAFLNIELSEITEKIVWLKVSKNKHPNKKSISDLVNILSEKKVIANLELEQKKDLLTKLNTLFSSKDTNLIFTNSNLSKKGKVSEYYLVLEQIVNLIL